MGIFHVCCRCSIGGLPAVTVCGRRREAADHIAAYVVGLLADVERKNGWQLAEQSGCAHSRGIQRVLDWYVWDAVRDEVRTQVVATLGTTERWIS